MEWSDTALVLGVGRFREADLWVRLLTRRHGIVSAFAFGGSRSRKRFCGCLDLFNELQVSTRTTRNGMYLSLLEGNLIRGPRRLRTDWNRLGMFMNCVRFVEALGVPPDGATGAFLLLKDTLELLEEAESVQDILPVLFRLRLASQQGYAPALDVCASCGRKEFDQAGFLVSEGTVVCPDCLSQRGNIVPRSVRRAGYAVAPGGTARVRESCGWLCAVSFRPDLGQGTFPEGVDLRGYGFGRKKASSIADGTFQC